MRWLIFWGLGVGLLSNGVVTLNPETFQLGLLSVIASAMFGIQDDIHHIRVWGLEIKGEN